MIKNIDKLDNIEKLSYYDLCDLKRSLEEKIKKRKIIERKLEKKYEEIKRKYSSPANTLEKLESATANHDLANIRIELSILNDALNKINLRLDLLKQKHILPQPDQE